MSRSPYDAMGSHPAAPGCRCRICRPEPPSDEVERRTISIVMAHGWQVMIVSDDAGCSHPDHHHDDKPEPAVPGLAYTVGLGHRADHPELMVSGLEPALMHSMLNGLAQRVVEGHRLSAGDVAEDVLAGVPVALHEVSETGLVEAVTWSGWFHRRRPDALAVVWPDRRGVFAWQAGAPEVLDERQPPRWRVPHDHRGGLAADPDWPFPVPSDKQALTCSHVVDRGYGVRWVARELDETRGEDWSVHCGADSHADEDVRAVHLAHLVRAAPSLRHVSDLALDEEAYRPDAFSPWMRSPLR